MTLQVVDGIAWQHEPRTVNFAEPGHHNWAVTGVQYVGIAGTNGWRGGGRKVFLHFDNTWKEEFHGFPSKEKANEALSNAPGVPSGQAPISALAAAFMKAKK